MVIANVGMSIAGFCWADGCFLVQCPPQGKFWHCRLQYLSVGGTILLLSSLESRQQSQNCQWLNGICITAALRYAC